MITIILFSNSNLSIPTAHSYAILSFFHHLSSVNQNAYLIAPKLPASFAPSCHSLETSLGSLRYFNLLRFVLKIKPHIIVTRHFYFSFVLKLFTCARVYVELHHLPSSLPLKIFFRLGIIDHFFVISKALFDELAVNGVKSSISSSKGSAYPNLLIPTRHNRHGVVFIGQPTVFKGFDFFLMLCKSTPSLDFYFYPQQNIDMQTMPDLLDIKNLHILNSYSDHRELIQALATHRIGIIPPRVSPMLSFDSRGRKCDISRYTSPLKFYDYCSAALRILAPLDGNSFHEYTHYHSVELLESNDVLLWSRTIISLYHRHPLSTHDPMFIQSGTWEAKARQYLSLGHLDKRVIS